MTHAIVGDPHRKPSPAPLHHASLCLVDLTAAALTLRLIEGQEKHGTDWMTVPPQVLYRELQRCLLAGDHVGVIAFAAFLNWRSEGKPAAPEIQRAPKERWRILASDEVMQEGDRVMMCNKPEVWDDVHALHGQTVGCYTVLRRIDPAHTPDTPEA